MAMKYRGRNQGSRWYSNYPISIDMLFTNGFKQYLVLKTYEHLSRKRSLLPLS